MARLPQLLFVCSSLLLLSTWAGPAQTSHHHERTRGLRSMGLTHEQVQAVKAAHDPHKDLHLRLNKEQLHDHPEIKRYRMWKEAIKTEGGHATAGAAFVGKIPLNFIHHVWGDAGQAGQQQQQYPTSTNGAELPYEFLQPEEL